MNRNVEIKAQVSDSQFEAALKSATRIAGQPPQQLTQNDTYFDCKIGRLKLRQFADRIAELIFYLRPDHNSPKTSFYQRTEIADEASLLFSLTGALGVRGRIWKQRQLFLIGSTRIHLDEVKQLGKFLELEVVLGPDDTVALGQKIAHELMQTLHIDSADLVSGSYIDLLEKSSNS